MRKMYFIVAVILFINNILLAQNKDADNLIFYNKRTSTTFSFDVNKYPWKPTNFMIGWQWRGDRNLSYALKMNTEQLEICPPMFSTWNYKPYDDTLHNIWEIKDGFKGGYRLPYALAAGYQYKATLLIYTNNNILIKIFYI